jgi:hypothetical protein
VANGAKKEKAAVAKEKEGQAVAVTGAVAAKVKEMEAF